MLLLEYQYLSGKMIEWRLFDVKQHQYKLVLGWVTIWLKWLSWADRLNWLKWMKIYLYDFGLNLFVLLIRLNWVEIACIGLNRAESD